MLGEGRKMGQNGEDGKGVRFPYLIWVVMACRDGYGGGAGEFKREREVVAKVRGRAGNVAGPFIAAVWR
jgi:hypothetical protein